MFPLILLQAKAVSILRVYQSFGTLKYNVSINSPSGEGGE